MWKRLASAGALFAFGLMLAPHLSLAQGAGQAPLQLQEPQAALDADTFVQRVTQGNIAEVQLGNLALERSQNPGVRNLAQKIIADHQASQDVLCGLSVVQSGAPLPQTASPAQMATLEQLSTLQGDEFDREFVRIIIAEHERAISAFEQAASTLDDPTLQSYALSQLPGLRDHLAIARALQSELETGGIFQ